MGLKSKVEAVLFCLLLVAGTAFSAEHRVVKGDTLFNISRRYGVSVADLQRWNNLSGPDIRIGQVLRTSPPAGTSQVRSIMHTVKKGETLWRIAYQNGVTVKALMDLNRIRDVGGLKAGQRIRIPVSGRPVDRPPPRKRGGRIPGLTISRPVRGPAEEYRKGVRIYCPAGTAAAAVLTGDVEYVGSLVGYKNIVIVRHKDDVYSVYAALDEVLVSQGQAVRQGQPLGRVDKLSHYDRSFLYFELVAGGNNVDPEKHFSN